MKAWPKRRTLYEKGRKMSLMMSKLWKNKMTLGYTAKR